MKTYKLKKEPGAGNRRPPEPPAAATVPLPTRAALTFWSTAFEAP
jgi:hypothetical protein